jgi:hypothetical protein
MEFLHANTRNLLGGSLQDEDTSPSQPAAKM